MHAFKQLIVIDHRSETPVYLQITNAFIQNIRKGLLRRGVQLPGSRELSSILRIHRKTLQNSYDELMAQGWIDIVPRKGTFVARDLPEIRPMRILSQETLRHYPESTSFLMDERYVLAEPSSDFQTRRQLIIDDGFPDIRIAPTDLLLREYRSLSGRSAFRKYYRYGNARGAAYLLEALAAFLADTRALPITDRQVMITRGAQMGIYMAAKVLLRPGDQVILGDPGYLSAESTFRQAGAVVHRVPVDEHGIDVDRIEALCRRKNIRLIYVVPHHHYPTTVTLVPERRMRLLELAAHFKIAIIEDDYDYDFHYSSSPILPMASLDYHGNVIYIGTLTKTLVPAIRVGFVVAPENFITTLSHVRRIIDWQGDSMMEVAIAELYRNGTIARHIKKSVKLYKERRDFFCSQMKLKLGKHVDFRIPDGGMSVWTTFQGVDLRTVASKAARRGLAMSDGTKYSTGKDYRNATRLGFASMTFNEQEKAIDILKNVIIS